MVHVCVSTTVREVGQRGYEVLVVLDAIVDRDIPGARAEDVGNETVLLELDDRCTTLVKF